MYYGFMGVDNNNVLVHLGGSLQLIVNCFEERYYLNKFHLKIHKMMMVGKLEYKQCSKHQPLTMPILKCKSVQLQTH